MLDSSKRPAYCCSGLWLGLLLLSSSRADDRVKLQEKSDPNRATRVTFTLKAEGTRPEFTASGEKRPEIESVTKTNAKPAPQAFPFEFESRLTWIERVRGLDSQGRVRQAVRRLERAEGEIDFFRGPGQKMKIAVRPELSLLLAERRGDLAILVSMGGPLTRSELDLIQTIGDPLLLPALLPRQPVVVGDRWELDPVIASTLTEYDQIAVNSLRAKLEAIDAKTARISLVGEVRGSVRGSSGSVALTGEILFDRVAGLINRLQLERAEARQSGPVESSLEAKSSLTLERTVIEIPSTLSDKALEGLPLESDAQRELLLLEPPDESYSLLHDRSWHIINDTVRRVVLRRMRGSVMEAQCDLIKAPNAGPGRHQDLGQLRDDIRLGLGRNFHEFVGEGELDAGQNGNFRYKFGVQGVEKENGIVPLWYYYLVAGPHGDQVIAIFTLSHDIQTNFSNEDERLIGSLGWKSPDLDHPSR